MTRLMHIAEPFATGVLSFLVDLTRRQVDDYEIFILWGERPQTPRAVETLFDPRIHLIRVESFRGAMATVMNPAAYCEVRKWFNRIRPNIVHFHSSASGFVGRWALPLGKTKAFYTPHGYSFLMPENSRLMRGLFWTMEKLSAPWPCTTVACGKGEYQSAQALTSRATYVNNGIDVSDLQPYVGHQTAIPQQPTVCTVGRILPQKNPWLFNEVAKLLPDFRFVWIGEGELRHVLTAPNIRVTGWMQRHDALRQLAQSDFFILPSFYEGLPISLLEAMYLKKVCVVSDVTGNRDVIRSGSNGIICKTADEFADVIRSCASQTSFVNQMAQAAHEDVLEHYNVENMAQAYRRIYESES